MATHRAEVTQRQIEQAVHELRGEKVLLDADLARMYGVTTKALVQAVRRNEDRFPNDFAFRLTAQEFAALRSQSVTSNNPGRGGRRYPPYAFTEQGVAMLSSVLHSPQAVQVNVEIMRVFVRIRRVIAVNADLARRLDEVERKVAGHDEQFLHVIRAIRQLMDPTTSTKRRRIGFHTTDEDSAEGQTPRAKKTRR